LWCIHREFSYKSIGERRIKHQVAYFFRYSVQSISSPCSDPWPRSAFRFVSYPCQQQINTANKVSELMTNYTCFTVLLHFGHAMLCISAAIAGTQCLCVRPSVRPSVTFVSCAKTNKDIFEIFPPSSSQAILVFPCQTGWH